MEYDIFEKIQKTGWNLWGHQQQYRHDFILDNLELQSLSREISIIRFFSHNMKYLPPEYTPISFSNAVKQPPVKFLSKFSTHVYIYLHDWLVKMISYPRSMSSILANSFTREDIRLSFFANVTFPSIFHNFETEELHKVGASLVNQIILNQPPYLIKAFMLSFIGFSTDFFSSLWQNFELEKKLLEENNNKEQIENPKIVLSIFLSSLSKSLVYLSESQIKLFKSLLNRSKEEFGRIILKTLFPNSYIEFYQDKIKEPKNSAIYQMLHSAGSYPDSPFFKQFVETITSPKFTKIRPSHKESGLMNTTPIILSLHELYVLQQIIFNGSKLKKSKPQNKEENIELDSSFDSFDSFEIDKLISARIKKGFFFFPPDVCKNKIEPISIEIDLTKFIGKVEEPIETSLFSRSLKNYQMVASKNENSEKNDQKKLNDKVVQFMKNFDQYLAHKSIQQFYRSSIKEKKLLLFHVLGSFSILCTDSMLEPPKPPRIIPKKPELNKLDPLHLFTPLTPQNEHKNNHEPLSIYNLKFPTSVSISNFSQADRLSSCDFESSMNNENKIEIKFDENMESEDLKELQLKLDIKEKLRHLLRKFSKPNDEISMFVLVRQLDAIESASEGRVNSDTIKKEVENENLRASSVINLNLSCSPNLSLNESNNSISTENESQNSSITVLYVNESQSSKESESHENESQNSEESEPHGSLLIESKKISENNQNSNASINPNDNGSTDPKASESNNSIENDPNQVFKKSIEKARAKSKKLIDEIDKNGYYRKYIKICALKIDGLAGQSHYEMIFGLLNVGLELNEISIQITKKHKKNAKKNMEIMKSFFDCLFMHSNNNMFSVFIWYHKFINTFPEIRKVIPREARIFIDFLVEYYYYSLNSKKKNQ